jgi:hypothetical protein
VRLGSREPSFARLQKWWALDGVVSHRLNLDILLERFQCAEMAVFGVEAIGKLERQFERMWRSG